MKIITNPKYIDSGDNVLVRLDNGVVKVATLKEIKERKAKVSIPIGNGVCLVEWITF